MQRDIWKKEEEEGRKEGTGHRTAEKGIAADFFGIEYE